MLGWQGCQQALSEGCDACAHLSWEKKGGVGLGSARPRDVLATCNILKLFWTLSSCMGLVLFVVAACVLAPHPTGTPHLFDLSAVRFLLLLVQVWTAERSTQLGMAVSSMLKGYTTTAAQIVTATLKSVTKFTIQVGRGLLRGPIPTGEGRSSRATAASAVCPSVQVLFALKFLCLGRHMLHTSLS